MKKSLEEIKKIPVIAVVGPTSSGKTSFSVEIAKKYSGEIISADSMQIYKGMNIATATPTKEEMKKIPHHLMSFLEIDRKFSVADYLNIAHEKAREIYNKGNVPIIVGGTGLYIDNFLSNTEFFDIKIDEERKLFLEKKAELEGGENLLLELFKVDEDLAKTLHENQHGRIIRGLLVYEATKKPLTFFKNQSKLKESPYTSVIIGLNFKNRQSLYTSINNRVDKMVEDGLIKEARDYYNMELSLTAKAAIGHKELHPFFEGMITEEAALNNLKQSTRRYAKRQLTWFRKNKDINWIYIDECEDFSDVINKGYNIVNSSKILD